MEMEGAWTAQVGTENAYQYNGKEHNEDFGLNWLDYGKRWYDPAIGRFPSVDPIIEKFPYLTPYNYASNDPVGKIDLWGLQGIRSNEPGLLEQASSALQQVGQGLQNMIQEGAKALGLDGQTLLFGYANEEHSQTVSDNRAAAAESTQKVEQGVTEVLRQGGETAENVGDLASISGALVFPVAPQVGAPLMTTGSWTARGGVAMQVAADLREGDSKSAILRSTIEIAGGVTMTVAEKGLGRAALDALSPNAKGTTQALVAKASILTEAAQTAAQDRLLSNPLEKQKPKQ
jgi:RHS repeat-associated protein